MISYENTLRVKKSKAVEIVKKNWFNEAMRDFREFSI